MPIMVLFILINIIVVIMSTIFKTDNAHLEEELHWRTSCPNAQSTGLKLIPTYLQFSRSQLQLGRGN